MSSSKLRPLLAAIIVVIATAAVASGCNEATKPSGSAVPTSATPTSATSETAPRPAPVGEGTGGPGPQQPPSVLHPVGRIVYQAGWGSNLGEFGFIPGMESITQGPGALWVQPDGSLYIADPVNHRVQVVSPEGKSLRAISIEARDMGDVAVASDGAVLVIDRDGGMIEVRNADGTLKGEVPAGGRYAQVFELLADERAVYAVVAAEANQSGPATLYVPVYEEGTLASVPKNDFPPNAERQPLGEGWSLTVDVASWDGERKLLPQGRLHVYPPDSLSFEVSVTPNPGRGLAVRTAKGNIMVSRSTEDGRNRLAWLVNADGVTTKVIEVPMPAGVVDVTGSVARLSPSGSLYQLGSTSEGITVTRTQVE